jgi:BMFP domain-containing protein YqiC
MNMKLLRAPFVATRQALSRRRFLQGVGVAMSLPLLDVMHPTSARAATSSPLPPNAKPRRMLGICNNLGVRPDLFFPTGTGRDYVASPYLKLLEAHRNDFTVISGVSHPNVDGGHPSDISFLTAAPHPASSSFRNTISLDQYIAERIGTLTRFPSLTLAINGAARSLSWTGTGVAIPPEQQASDVFNQLFLQGTPEQVEAQIRRLDTGRSILDAVADQSKDLQRNVSARDRSRLDQYFSSVRDLEHRLQESRAWESKPKPVVSLPAPREITAPAQYMDKLKAMYDLARLAFETDSTRAITLMLNSVGTPVVNIDGETITDSYHNLSHHGKAEEKLAQLKVLDEWQMKLLANLFKDLKAVNEEGENLLDRTMILYGSNLGDANAHSTINLPTLFAGGGFHHGQHLAFDRAQNYPLPNLFVSMLQRVGLEEDKFASSTGAMRGLEMT